MFAIISKSCNKLAFKLLHGPFLRMDEKMSGDFLITSLQNQRIKQVVKLRQRAFRDQTGWMLVEGYREIRRALDNHYRPSTLFTCPAFYLGKNEPPLVEQCRAAGAEIIVCTEPVFEKIAYRERPEGLLAILPQMRASLDQLPLRPQPLLVVAEAIEKPGNLGTMLRSADAAGADAVIVCDPRTDIYNPNVVRASIGTIFSVPVVTATFETTHAWLRQHRIQTLAATPHARQTYTEPDLTSGVAIVLGTEQFGLSERWMSAADWQVRIPMHGQADSLNVAAAATILLFEARRQRDAAAAV